MITFLPFPCFRSSVKALDNKRLGKQRIEAQMILDYLEGNRNDRWKNHPAIEMWKGYNEALKFYINCCIDEWTRRKKKDGAPFKNTMKIHEIDFEKLKYPWWFDKEKFHASHRSNLLRKDYAFYSKYAWQESTDLLYIWPKGEE
jgi:hypothetical protein